MSERARGSFGPLVLLGIGSAGLLALASAKVWVSPILLLDGRTVIDPGSADIGSLPLAGALGLLLLASWGAVLVTRRRVRRAVGVLALVVAVGLVACAVAGFVTLPGDVRDHFASQTAAGGGYRLRLTSTPWLWTAAVAAPVAAVVAALSVLRMGAWPEMGKRYDAPVGGAGAPAASVPIGERDERELWRDLDEGRDPTADQSDR